VASRLGGALGNELVVAEGEGVIVLLYCLKSRGCHGAPLRGVRLRDFLRELSYGFWFSVFTKKSSATIKDFTEDLRKKIASPHGCNHGDGLWQAPSACIVALLIGKA